MANQRRGVGRRERRPDDRSERVDAAGASRWVTQEPSWAEPSRPRTPSLCRHDRAPDPVAGLSGRDSGRVGAGSVLGSEFVARRVHQSRREDHRRPRRAARVLRLPRRARRPLRTRSARRTPHRSCRRVTTQPRSTAARRLDTVNAALVLKELTVGDARTYYRVLDRNRAHLSHYGDYQDEANATPAWATDHLSRPAPDRFGIWLDHHLIGRVDLVHAAPPRYGLGYWLSHDAVGRGHAT